MKEKWLRNILLMTSKNSEISIIIPAFNEEQLIENTLDKSARYLENHFPDSEILVVNDGSTDNTGLILNNFIDAYQGPIKIHLVINDKNRGKGFSIRHGVEKAKGKILIFFDADLPYDLSGIEKIIETISKGYDVVLGSRLISESKVKVRIPLLRQLASKVYRRIVHLFFSIDAEDTQCGFKGFTETAAKKIFAYSTIEGFGFDIEVIVLALKFNFKLTSIPVVFINQRQQSKINIVKDSFRMLGDMIKVKKRISQMENYTL